MYPLLIELNFHAVNRIYGLLGVALLHLSQHLVGIDIRGQLDFIFRDKIARIGVAQPAHGEARFSQVRHKQGDAHQRVAAIV